MQSVVRSYRRRVCQTGFVRTLSSATPTSENSIKDTTVAVVRTQLEGFVRGMKDAGSRPSRKLRKGNNEN
jgi:hypothetical protein